MKESHNGGKKKLVQAIANTLFNFPSTETNDGPIVQLPPPTTKLPREKHVPKPIELAAKELKDVAGGQVNHNILIRPRQHPPLK